MSGKRGLSFKLQNSTFSTDTELNSSTEMHVNLFYKIKGIKKTGLNKTGFLFFIETSSFSQVLLNPSLLI